MPQARELPDGVVFVLPECDIGFSGVQGVKLGYFEAFVAEFPVEGLGETASPGLRSPISHPRVQSLPLCPHLDASNRKVPDSWCKVGGRQPRKNVSF